MDEWFMSVCMAARELLQLKSKKRVEGGVVLNILCKYFSYERKIVS